MNSSRANELMLDLLRQMFVHRGPAKGPKYPLALDLPAKDGVLHFEACSDVECFRIRDYGGEKGFLDQFVAALQPGDVVFDIGASIGLMTVHAAAAVKNGKVVAFEPDPETLQRLKRNVSLNNLRNVQFQACGLSDKP